MRQLVSITALAFVWCSVVFGQSANYELDNNNVEKQVRKLQRDGSAEYAVPAIVGAFVGTRLSQKDDPPETVIITYQVIDGRESEMEQLIKRQWKTLVKLGLVFEDFHHLFRGKDDTGKAFFVEVLTWKNHAAPDNAPKEVLEIWNAMQPLVERRLGHDGIEYPEVRPVKPEK